MIHLGVLWLVCQFIPKPPDKPAPKGTLDRCARPLPDSIIQVMNHDDCVSCDISMKQGNATGRPLQPGRGGNVVCESHAAARTITDACGEMSQYEAPDGDTVMPRHLN
eukprot:jgi/Ulvmu1/591/UM001_0599.1